MNFALQIVWHDRRRFGAAIVAVAFSCLLIILQCGLVLGLFSSTSIPNDQAGADVWVGHPEVSSVDLGRSLPEVWQSFLALPEVERYEPFMEGFGFWDKPEGGMELVILIGTRLGPDSLGAIGALTSENRQRLSELGSVVVDEGDFEKLGIAGVGDTAEVFDKRVRVVGTVTGCRNLTAPYLFCSFDTAQWILRWPKEQCTFFLAKCRQPRDAQEVVEKLNAFPSKFAAYTAADFSLKSRMHWLIKTKAGIAFGLSALLGILVGAIVTSQTLYAATAASFKEYAVLRALGIPRWRLALMVMAQSFWVGLGGILLAMPIVVGFYFFGQQIGTKILLPAWLLLGAVSITLIMATGSGLFALQSLRFVDPVRLLRS
jgi:putative ABC transport system permease protein